MLLFINVLVFLSIFSVFVNGQLGDTCTTPNDEAGICDYFTLCDSLYSLLSKPPVSRSNRNLISQSQCGSINRKALVCCPDSVSETRIGTGTNLLPEPGECGIDVSSRIIGGTETEIDEYPWMALLQYSKPNNKKGFHCGGALINQRYVLTASHCVNGIGIPSTWTLSSVRLGEWDLQTTTDCVTDNGQTDCADPVVDVPIAELIPNENYRPSSKNQDNDIALIRLQKKVQYTDFIKPICLPRSQNLRNYRYESISLSVAGWGKTESASQSDVKLKVSVDGVSLNECNRAYNTQGIQVGETQLCAGGKYGADSCRGDSGGPIMKLDSNTGRPYWYLVGVVSFGSSPCGQEGWPGVYTKISSHIDWIEKKLRA